MRVFFRSKSEEINEEDVHYYHTERCIEAGEEYDPELKWLNSESELEVDNDQSSGCGSGVLEGSFGEYFAPSGISDGRPVNVEFVRPAGGGYAPDVTGGYGDVGDVLCGPGIPGGSSKECVEGSQEGRDRHH